MLTTEPKNMDQSSKSRFDAEPNFVVCSFHWAAINKGCPHLGIVAGGEDLISVLLYRFQFKTKEFLPNSYISPGLEDWESEGSGDSR